MSEQPSCAERIAEQYAGREERFRLYFDDLDSITDEDAVALAMKHLDGFEVTDEERELIGGWDDSEAWQDLADRARRAVQGFRDSSNADEELLSMRVRIAVRLDISTGGPADYLTFEVDRDDCGIENVRYHFADWFDHAEREVTRGDSLWKLCEEMAEYAVEAGR